MVENEKIPPREKFGSSLESFVTRLGKFPKLHLALLFLLLEEFIERRKFRFMDLRKFQVEGIQLAIQRRDLMRRMKGIFLVAPMGSGKTVVAYLFLGVNDCGWVYRGVFSAAYPVIGSKGGIL